jgi:hypothetical protein
VRDLIRQVPQGATNIEVSERLFVGPPAPGKTASDYPSMIQVTYTPPKQPTISNPEFTELPALNVPRQLSNPIGNWLNSIGLKPLTNAVVGNQQGLDVGVNAQGEPTIRGAVEVSRDPVGFGIKAITQDVALLSVGMGAFPSAGSLIKTATVGAITGPVASQAIKGVMGQGWLTQNELVESAKWGAVGNVAFSGVLQGAKYVYNASGLATSKAAQVMVKEISPVFTEPLQKIADTITDTGAYKTVASAVNRLNPLPKLRQDLNSSYLRREATESWDPTLKQKLTMWATGIKPKETFGVVGLGDEVREGTMSAGFKQPNPVFYQKGEPMPKDWIPDSYVEPIPGGQQYVDDVERAVVGKAQGLPVETKGNFNFGLDKKLTAIDTLTDSSPEAVMFDKATLPKRDPLSFGLDTTWSEPKSLPISLQKQVGYVTTKYNVPTPKVALYDVPTSEAFIDTDDVIRLSANLSKPQQEVVLSHELGHYVDRKLGLTNLKLEASIGTIDVANPPDITLLRENTAWNIGAGIPKSAAAKIIYGAEKRTALATYTGRAETAVFGGFSQPEVVARNFTPKSLVPQPSIANRPNVATSIMDDIVWELQMTPRTSLLGISRTIAVEKPSSSGALGSSLFKGAASGVETSLLQGTKQTQVTGYKPMANLIQTQPKTVNVNTFSPSMIMQQPKTSQKTEQQPTAFTVQVERQQTQMVDRDQTPSFMSGVAMFPGLTQRKQSDEYEQVVYSYPNSGLAQPTRIEPIQKQDSIESIISLPIQRNMPANISPTNLISQTTYPIGLTSQPPKQPQLTYPTLGWTPIVSVLPTPKQPTTQTPDLGLAVFQVPRQTYRQDTMTVPKTVPAQSVYPTMLTPTRNTYLTGFKPPTGSQGGWGYPEGSRALSKFGLGKRRKEYPIVGAEDVLKSFF